MNILKDKVNIKVILSITLLLCSLHIASAQDEDVKWYENRDEAIEAAKEQDKNILLLYGRNSCGNCSAAKKFLNEDPSLRKVVDENFILWFCDTNTCDYGDDYYPGGPYYLPLLCVLDPYNPVPALDFTTGYKDAAQIQKLLESKLPTFNDKWHRDKATAINTAKEQKKNILLLYGRNTCPRCNAAKEIINEASINQIVNKNFILWYCNIDNEIKKKQGIEYREVLGQESIPLPLLCVIDPNNPEPALASSTGGKNQNEIKDFLNSYLPTSNEPISGIITNAYINENVLYLSNITENEMIHVYTLDGLLIDSFEKNDKQITRNVFSYPKGVLLISSSKGWNIKITK